MLSITDSLSLVHTIVKFAHQVQEPLGLPYPTRCISKYTQLVLFGYTRSCYLTLSLLSARSIVVTVDLFVPATTRYSFIIASSEFARAMYRSERTDFGTANR